MELLEVIGEALGGAILIVVLLVLAIKIFEYIIIGMRWIAFGVAMLVGWVFVKIQEYKINKRRSKPRGS